ncbi:uncharacterized protein [Molothrus aeneus]|uniref:uncharacterized protein n=1 Tax=Molothrus aeneus TaxID=84833 RepID=UPI00345B1BEB
MPTHVTPANYKAREKGRRGGGATPIWGLGLPAALPRAAAPAPDSRSAQAALGRRSRRPGTVPPGPLRPRSPATPPAPRRSAPSPPALPGPRWPPPSPAALPPLLALPLPSPAPIPLPARARQRRRSWRGPRAAAAVASPRLSPPPRGGKGSRGREQRWGGVTQPYPPPGLRTATSGAIRPAAPARSAASLTPAIAHPGPVRSCGGRDVARLRPPRLPPFLRQWALPRPRSPLRSAAPVVPPKTIPAPKETAGAGKRRGRK